MQRTLTITLLSAIPIFLLGYAEGPPASFSGAPNERTCTLCHGGNPNTGSGTVTITFPGASYVPNQTYAIQVTVSDPNAVRWGFELTARADANSGVEAGTMASTDGMTQVVQADVLQWIEHTLQGTRVGKRQSATFQFNWTAPAANSGTIVFYAAAVAANGDGTNTGDLVYTTCVKVPMAALPAAPPSISSSGVADAWTGQPGIAPGAWIRVSGTAISDTEANWSPVAGSPLPTTLAGVSVTVNDIVAAISHVCPTSVTLLVPGSLTGVNAKIVVQRDGIAGNPAWVPITAALPTIYSVADPNSNPTQYYAAVTTAGAGIRLSLVNRKGAFLGNSAVDPRAVRGVYAGESIDLYATGLGATMPDFPTDQLLNSPRTVAGTVNVHFGDTIVSADSVALVEPGMYQLRVTVPATLTAGMTPLALDLNGFASTANVLLRVDSNVNGAQ
jgi:uncharacterized protein (TIGR03437 family)